MMLLNKTHNFMVPKKTKVVLLLAKTAWRSSFYDKLEKRLTNCIKSGHQSH